MIETIGVAIGVGSMIAAFGISLFGLIAIIYCLIRDRRFERNRARVWNNF